jgi:hypothetical protein
MQPALRFCWNTAIIKAISKRQFIQLYNRRKIVPCSYGHTHLYDRCIISHWFIRFRVLKAMQLLTSPLFFRNRSKNGRISAETCIWLPLELKYLFLAYRIVKSMGINPFSWYMQFWRGTMTSHPLWMFTLPNMGNFRGDLMSSVS